MTRKDYIALAAAINGATVTCYGQTAKLPRDAESFRFELMARLTDALASDNSRFDKARFMKAAGVAAWPPNDE